jgi:hypothetical protein
MPEAFETFQAFWDRPPVEPTDEPRVEPRNE